MKLVGNSKAIRSPEFHRKKQREKWVKFSLFILLLLALLSTPVFILRSEKLLISEIEIMGNEVTAEEEIREIVSEHLSGEYLSLIPKESTVLLKRGRIEQSLLSQIPRLSSANVSLKNLQILEVLVVERDPFALYCERVFYPGEPSGCYFLDKTGYIFSEAPNFSGGVYLIYTAEEPFSSPLRTQMIEPKAFEDLNDFINGLSRLGLDPEVLVSKSDEYALILKSGAELRFKTKQDLSLLASDLEVFLRNLKGGKSTLDNLLYLDLRIANKVFYRFRNE